MRAYSAFEKKQHHKSSLEAVRVISNKNGFDEMSK
jgi:hypothetical protein